MKQSDYKTTKSFMDDRKILHIGPDIVKQVMAKFRQNVLKGTPNGGFTLMLDNPHGDQEGVNDVVDFYFIQDQEHGWFKTSLQRSGIFGNIENVLSDAFREAQIRVATYSGNPDGKPIYPNKIDHGYGEPLSGGTDVMRRLQNQLLHEQGSDDQKRPESPRLASYRRVADRFEKVSFKRVADAWWGADPEVESSPMMKFTDYMDANAVRFPKGMTGWWLPAHNFGIRVDKDGKIIVLSYQMLPHWNSPTLAYTPDDPKITVAPMWRRTTKLIGVARYEPSVPLAQKLLKMAMHEPTIQNTVKGELQGLEDRFGIIIPPEVKTKLIFGSIKNAISRWAATSIKTSVFPI